MKVPLLLTSLLLACADDAGPEAALPADAAPPPTVARVRAPQVFGLPLRFRFILPAAPGARLHIFLAPSRNRHACAGGLPGLCIQLDAPVQVAVVDVDPDGVTDVEIPWDPRFRQQFPYYSQAAVTRRGATGATSPVWYELYYPDDSDDDGDGLDNAAEHAAHTRPDVADTDGGGANDGYELLLHTDPTDPTDDRPPEVACHDGADNDNDALVDCEDADCEAACTERACTDGADDDQDGATDCDDEDCWGPTCNTSTLVWRVAARGSGWARTHAGPLDVWLNSGTPFFHADLTGVAGRVRTVGPQGVNTCSWSAGPVIASAWLGYTVFRGDDFIRHDPLTERGVRRPDPVVTPGCFITALPLPDPGSSTFAPDVGIGWYTPLDVVSSSVQGAWSVKHVAFDEVACQVSGACPNGQAPTRYYLDQDGDGFGVSANQDLYGALGGCRYTCDALPPGAVTAGGDCDDADATWNPDAVHLLAGVSCADLGPLDRDGDGALAPDDPNDLDPLTR